MGRDYALSLFVEVDDSDLLCLTLEFAEVSVLWETGLGSGDEDADAADEADHAALDDVDDLWRRGLPGC